MNKLAKRQAAGLVKGGKAADIAAKLRKRQQSALQAVSKIDRILMADASGSMATVDAIDLTGQTVSRWDALQQAWGQLNKAGKGRLGAYSYSDSVQAVRGSASGESVTLPYLGGGTKMCAAIRQIGVHATTNPRIEALLISDGEPTDGTPAEVVEVAAGIACPIHTVFVGPKGSSGIDVLRRIAEVTGGTFLDLSGVGGFVARKFLAHATRVLLKGG